jgi:hypothetical protein
MAVGFEKYSVQVAMAVREVIALEVMDTMCAAPEGVRCVSSSGTTVLSGEADVVGTGDLEE